MNGLVEMGNGSFGGKFFGNSRLKFWNECVGFENWISDFLMNFFGILMGENVNSI